MSDILAASRAELGVVGAGRAFAKDQFLTRTDSERRNQDDDPSI